MKIQRLETLACMLLDLDTDELAVVYAMVRVGQRDLDKKLSSPEPTFNSVGLRRNSTKGGVARHLRHGV
ncbi:MAG: hypothetical protein U0Q18_25500 [Bryobacteraceae bacterium]